MPPTTSVPVPETAPLRRPSVLERWTAALQACLFGYPEEFQAPPLGETIGRHFRTEVANGEAARMVLHHYDFDCDGKELNQRGKDHLAKIICMVPRNFFPIIVERTPLNPGLAEARRVAVLNELSRAAFPVPPERVLIGPPLSNSLSGVEALLVYQNLLQQTSAGSRGSAGAVGGVGPTAGSPGSIGGAPGGAGAGTPGGGP
jgi:hypothetical protein